MFVDSYKLDICMAKAGVNASNLKSISRGTLKRMKDGENIYPKTIGRLANELGVDVVDLIADKDVYMLRASQTENDEK